jgi:hypothetical protein
MRSKVLSAGMGSSKSALPELDLVRRDCGLVDPEQDHRDLTLAQNILHLVDALRHTIQIYRDFTL